MIIQYFLLFLCFSLPMLHCSWQQLGRDSGLTNLVQISGRTTWDQTFENCTFNEGTLVIVDGLVVAILSCGEGSNKVVSLDVETGKLRKTKELDYDLEVGGGLVASGDENFVFYKQMDDGGVIGLVDNITSYSLSGQFSSVENTATMYDHFSYALYDNVMILLSRPSFAENEEGFVTTVSSAYIARSGSPWKDRTLPIQCDTNDCQVTISRSGQILIMEDIQDESCKSGFRSDHIWNIDVGSGVAGKYHFPFHTDGLSQRVSITPDSQLYYFVQREKETSKFFLVSMVMLFHTVNASNEVVFDNFSPKECSPVLISSFTSNLFFTCTSSESDNVTMFFSYHHNIKAQTLQKLFSVKLPFPDLARLALLPNDQVVVSGNTYFEKDGISSAFFVVDSKGEVVKKMEFPSLEFSAFPITDTSESIYFCLENWKGGLKTLCRKV